MTLLLSLALIELFLLEAALLVVAAVTLVCLILIVRGILLDSWPRILIGAFILYVMWRAILRWWFSD